MKSPRLSPPSTSTATDLPDSSLKIVLPLERTNLLFLVGGPPSPIYPPNKVVFWDDKAKQAIAELEFREEVLGLAARRDRLVVALKRRVLVFVLGEGATGIWREGAYETTENPKGLLALATKPGSTLLAFPGRQPGQIQVVHLPLLDPRMPPLPPPPSHDPTSAPYPSVSIILAHTTSLSALSTTPDGSLIASASSKGTLVRVWGARSSYLVKELRRGTDWAEIFGISFRADGGAVANQLSLLRPYLPKYFSSEWSHSQFRLPPPAPPASRLPFSLSNPSPYPATPFTRAPKGEGEGRAAPLTVEDDVCLSTSYIPSSPLPSAGQQKKTESQLVAITHSGRWYRIAFDPVMEEKGGKGKGKASDAGGGGPSGSSTPRSSIGAAGKRASGKNREDSGPVGLGKDSTSDCRLVEYRRFGVDEEGW
ncbi:SVP1-like protein 2 [Rhodotorula toruloides]|uniref:SVP1-like protein 2 n=1 Tax=Rhodotorula toruloides TaxID=5286 RepID=A0A511KAL1_RHOTO|nr:SVP1-like protein 2 [Rhodotorula toruloides]